MNEDQLKFKNYLIKHNLFSQDKFEKFEQYANLLLKKNKQLNLISKNSCQHLWTRHFLDSILIQEQLNLKKKTVVDFGSGAGFPSIPIKILYPTFNLYLIESIRKKTLFLKYLIEKLDLSSCKIIRNRFENISNLSSNSCDYILVRAVNLNKNYFKKAFQLLAHKGKIVLYRGAAQDDNIVKKLPSDIDYELNKINIKDSTLGESKFITLGIK